MKLKLLVASLALASGALYAQTVEVKEAWVRSAVPGQQGTGAFMSLTSKDAARLVGASSPVAGVVQVHEMKMEGDVMKMRAVPALDLPAGQTVQLKPGGYHIMLMDLKQALPKGSTVSLTLVFKDAKGTESKLELKLPVSVMAPGTMAGMTHGRASMAGHDMAAPQGEHKR